MKLKAAARARYGERFNATLRNARHRDLEGTRDCTETATQN